MRWQDVEVEVRKIAESVWSVQAEPTRVTGVKCDAILKPRKDYWILIEISKRDDLDKLREDIAKLALIRPSLLAKGIYCECYFVTSGDHTSLVESGDELNIEVHDLASFASKFIGSTFYIRERQQSPFGSAVHPDTGEVDPNEYSEINYVDEHGRTYGVKRICDAVPGFILPVYSIGLIVIFLSNRDQRVGDIFAGTVVVREREGVAPTFAETFSTRITDVAFTRVQKQTETSANVALLNEREVEVVESFLRRRWDLTDRQRLWMAWRIALPLMYKLKPTFEIENFTYEGFLEEILHRFHAKQRFLNERIIRR